MTADAAFKLRREAEAARKLLSMLRDAGEDGDAEIVETAIEGETNLHEAIAAVIDQIDECEVHILGLKAKEQAFADRRDAFVKRAETLRAAIEQAMLAAEAEKMTLATATVFLSKRAPGLIVNSEADIPSEFFRVPEPPAPKLDRKALTAALRDKREVPGASLDNGGFSLSIRRK